MIGRGLLILSVAWPLGVLSPVLGQGRGAARGERPMYSDYRDATTPLFETTLDLRESASPVAAGNLAPRVVALTLGENVAVGFDTELLRLAAIWRGRRLTPRGLATRSYATTFGKAPPGQSDLPEPGGPLVASTGLHPGWHTRGAEAWSDPRPRWLAENELGRGPLPREVGQWRGVADRGDGVSLHYEVSGAQVEERYRARTTPKGIAVERWIKLTGAGAPRVLSLVDFGADDEAAQRVRAASAGVAWRAGNHLVAELPSNDRPHEMVIRYELNADDTLQRIVVAEATPPAWTTASPRTGPRWPERVEMTFEDPRGDGAYRVENLALAYPNPWARRIRPVDLVFRADGSATVLTFDGDVYRVEGLHTATSTWRRIAAGFNEPQSLAERDGEIFVFSRLGITRLVDNDGDGETDYYALFSNRFVQSAESRDMPMTLTALPDGSFLICKGGQQIENLSPHSGRVLRVSADGREAEVYASGIRNGYVAQDPLTGLITASDQQGNWVPSTPLLVLEPGGFYGFGQSVPEEPPATSAPALWIPHRVSQSGIKQVWARDERLGSLQGSMLWLDYQGPRLLKVMLDPEHWREQAAVMPVPVDVEVPLLGAAINPVDGRFYMVGFQIWGSNAKRHEGLSRLSVVAGVDALPVRARGFREGVLLEFPSPLDPTLAGDPGSYEARSWEYRRTPAYGSAQYRADGSFGEDPWDVHRVLVSPDRRRVFLAIKDLRPTMQFALDYNLFGDWTSAYFTFHELEKFDPSDEGFEVTDMTTVFAHERAPRTVRREETAISAERGQQLYEQYACIGCHSIDGSMEGKIGPSFAGLYWKDRELTNGETVSADDAYLRRSILRPEFQVVAGFGGDDASMPSFQGILNRDDLASLVLFIKSLASVPEDAPE
ncbi:DUF6797 domain-containing protein [Synoicihabitans lomoniglobus]|uniref:C-type cytochrome n=1 Tax=Synoicihabitans lomoniglobus TaxID=2909285 RepID=A0AAE9ZW88_9BACT|nr:c-type cytochrome [Opitutaceae bacterium LMO-M01]WED64244.1 c-type cytochrome [Opitutaceae bacterium LMO-M01]